MSSVDGFYLKVSVDGQCRWILFNGVGGWAHRHRLISGGLVPFQDWPIRTNWLMLEKSRLVERVHLQGKIPDKRSADNYRCLYIKRGGISIGIHSEYNKSGFWG
jgi:hypothetical protein